MEQQVSDITRNGESKKSDNKRGKETPTPEDTEHLRQQLEALQTENRSLKERLLDMGVPIEQTSLSDSEKEQILLRRSASGSMASLDSERKEGCQCGASIGSANRSESTEHLASGGGELDVCEMSSTGGALEDSTLGGRPLFEWDKASSSSVSEMSVACLQDRIMQMEETHYSTSEELQATLQELTDLQDQLTDLQMDNERMGEEKTVLLESLCSQTEKLEDCRSQIQQLKQLLLSNYEEGFKSDISMVASDREMHYVQLLKTAQEEQENLIQKHKELSASLQASKDQSETNINEFLHLKERVRFLESTIETVHIDRRLLEEHLSESQEQFAAGQIEVAQLRLQLENEQQKVKDLQRERDACAASELENLLQETRKDKERTEEKLLHFQEQLSLSQREIARLKEHLSQLQEEAMVAKNNAHKQVSDLQFLVSQLESGKLTLQKESDLVSEALRQSEANCQRHLEDKRELIANIAEMQKALAERQARIKELTRDLEQSKDKLTKDTEEWLKFQCDLLTSVRVANDLRMEAQQDVEKTASENKHMKEKIEGLQAEINRLKDRQQELMSAAVSPIGHSLPSLHRGSPLRALTPEAGDRHCDLPSAAAAVVATASTAARRQMGTAAKLAGTQLSVKSLIESIENATKQAKEIGLGSSRSSSTSSLSSIASESRKIASSLILGSSAGDLFLKPSLCGSLPEVTTSVLNDNSLKVPGPVMGGLQSCRETYSDTGLYPKSGSNSSSDPSSKNSLLDTSVKHPVSILASKLEPMRRNSFGDFVEKKDPLCALVKGGGSKRNALLKWCQNKTVGYKGIDITNFSSSWNDGLAFCALMHSYLPDEIPYLDLDNKDKRRNFSIAFQAAESVGILTTLNINDLISQERPDWQSIMTYVTSIYKHFEM